MLGSGATHLINHSGVRDSYSLYHDVVLLHFYIPPTFYFYTAKLFFVGGGGGGGIRIDTMKGIDCFLKLHSQHKTK